MDKLYITCFGKVCVQFGEGMVKGLEVQKAQELLCYTLLYREHAHHRDKLATILWRDCTTHQARAYLRKAIWQIQNAINELFSIRKTPMFLMDSDWMQLNPELPIYMDALDFLDLYQKINNQRLLNVHPRSRQVMEKAVKLYKGDFLEGWYQEWCLFERERFEYIFLCFLDKLVQLCSHDQDYETGIEYGRRILQIDQAREHAHYSLMQLYELAGYRIEALRQYHRCAEVLQAELQVSPSQRTRNLYETLKADNYTYRTQSSHHTWSQTIHYLQNAKTLLDDMNVKVQQSIKEVQQVSNS